MTFETENIEFKTQFTEDLYKEIIAFANTDGGVVYVGIDNEGNAVGLSDVDQEYTRITNGIRDAILPDVTMFVRFTIQENRVVRITVSEGTNKPYYLKGKGIKPGGVFVRQGASSVPASFEQIRQMIKESDGDDFEQMRSAHQTLTFQAAEGAFQRYGVDFDKKKYRTLGMTKDDDALFTNLALIISDQCAHTTKVAVFSDTENTSIRDTKEFGGSVFEQLEDAFAYLTLCNKTEVSFRGLERIENRDYPEEALREALLNALVHRDYSFSGSVIINVNPEQIEFISIGGLLQGLTIDDIRLGVSQTRNKNLAEMFHRLRLVESYGTGIRRIYKLYEGCPVQPAITVTSNAFKLVLPNKNALPVSRPDRATAVTPQMLRILAYIKERGSITDVEIQNLLGVKKTRAFNLIKQMCDQNLVLTHGRGASKRYLLR